MPAEVARRGGTLCRTVASATTVVVGGRSGQGAGAVWGQRSATSGSELAEPTPIGRLVPTQEASDDERRAAAPASRHGPTRTRSIWSTAATAGARAEGDRDGAPSRGHGGGTAGVRWSRCSGSPGASRRRRSPGGQPTVTLTTVAAERFWRIVRPAAVQRGSPPWRRPRLADENATDAAAPRLAPATPSEDRDPAIRRTHRDRSAAWDPSVAGGRRPPAARSESGADHR